MTAVFDLDYTLFDTAAFKDAMASALAAFGVTRERFDETYAATVLRDGGAYDYDPEEHVRRLKAEIPGADTRKQAAAAIEGVVRKSRDFLYPGAIGLISSLRGKGVRSVLLTLGNQRWQNKKVSAAGLKRYFEDIRTVQAGKEGMIKDIMVGDATVVVNDNGAEIDAMAEAAPEAIYIWKRGPKSPPVKAKVITCDTLEDVGRAVRNAFGIGT